jgi:type I restriction enzyme R subunit
MHRPVERTVEDDPEFDVKKAQKKLRRYVKSHEHAIQMKAEIMVDHLHEKVAALQKIGGQARAMVVTGSIERAIQYFSAFRSTSKSGKVPMRRLSPSPGSTSLAERNRPSHR